MIRTLSSHPVPLSLMRGASERTAEEISADPRFFYRQVLRVGLVIFVTVFLFILAVLLSATPSRAAQPVVMTEAEMANVTGQAGISVYMNITTRYTASVMKFSDTESIPNWLELQNITVDDGAGGYYLIATPSYDEANTVDIGTNDAGRTLVAVKDYSHVSPRWYSVGNIFFCDPGNTNSLGSLNLDALSMGPSVLHYGAHADGTGGGFDFDYKTRVYAQALRYTYNTTTSESLNLSGIHLAYAADALGKDGITPDNPADPTNWAFTGAGNVFRIGDIDNSNPAKVDVVTDTITGVTSLVLNLPMEGSLRVENVAFSGSPSFGPIAIDGIRVHRLSLEIR